MKLLLDLQGAQCQSRHRGIGRYTLALSHALLNKTAEQHEVLLLLNSRFEVATDSLISKLGSHARPERRVMLDVPAGVNAERGSAWLRRAAARTMRHAIECTDANIVWHSSVVEGYFEDVLLPDAPLSNVASVATLYDLIPMHAADTYLSHPRARRWYEQSIETLRRCDRLFSISEWVRQDALDRLRLPPERIVNIGTGVDSSFKASAINPSASNELRRRFGITCPFVLYNGGLDPRKNVATLIHAFAALPPPLRTAYQLVIVGHTDRETLALLKSAMHKARLSPDSVIFTGYAHDKDLVRLYTECALFAFPSLLEGFGLPPLEAMACGAPVIASNTTSLPEVIGRRDALFDPHRIDSISERMTAVLSNAEFAAELSRYGLDRAKNFQWDAVADRALDALHTLVKSDVCTVSVSSGRPALTCVVADNVAFPAWLSELDAHIVSLSDADSAITGHDTQLVLYVTTPSSAHLLEKHTRIRPGALLVTAESGPTTKPLSATTLRAAYKGDGYIGIMSALECGSVSIGLCIAPLLEHVLGVLCTDKQLHDQISATVSEKSLDISVLPARHTSQACMQYLSQSYAMHPLAREARLIDELSLLEGDSSNEDMAVVAAAIVNARKPKAIRQWLVDVSSIASSDIRTGVQRVVRNVLIHWLRQPPTGDVRIEPVRFSNGRFRYARRYTLDLLGLKGISLPDEAVNAVNGDIFIGLDWAVDCIADAEPQLRDWRRRGVRTYFLVHDLLPIKLPEMFHPYARNRFIDWLRSIAAIADGLACVSQATAEDLMKWLRTTELHYQFARAPAIGNFSLGVDATLGSGTTVPRKELADAIQARPTLLMVGTIEPRKGYDQVLDACEMLWSTGVDFNLFIIGRFGWLMEDLHKRLDHHAEKRQRLFWIDDVNDAELDAIYHSSSALMAASWGEGYGLPLIEAARRGLPVIARDLPVFREVMGDRACYFSAPMATDLADVLCDWLATPRPHTPINTESWITWEQSAAGLAKIVLGFADFE